MSDSAPAPEADRAEGAPHPRETTLLLGQETAERAFLAAFASGRLHHGWLITGARGIGKATLAWRIARFLLAAPAGGDGGLLAETAPAPPPERLEIDPDHPVCKRIAALSEPRLFLLRRGWDEGRKRLKAAITVDEVRRLKSFFQLSAADGARRVVIVDCADELNINAANALLKLLEEPPKGAVLLLVSHRPSGLLPTLRSRCRELRCNPLEAGQIARAMEAAGIAPPEDPVALAELAGGSVGEAVRLAGLDGIRNYARIVSLLEKLPELDRPAALALAESAAGRDRQQEARFDMILRLLDLFLARTARCGVGLPPPAEAAPGEAALIRRLAPGPDAARLWAGLQQELGVRARRGRAVNLEPAALIFDMLLRIRDGAARLAG